MSTQQTKSLTARQQEYVDFVKRFWDKKGYGPSESEVAEHFLVSPVSAHLMIVKLCQIGALIRDAHVARSVRPPGHSGVPTVPPPGSWVYAPWLPKRRQRR